MLSGRTRPSAIASSRGDNRDISVRAVGCRALNFPNDSVAGAFHSQTFGDVRPQKSETVAAVVVGLRDVRANALQLYENITLIVAI